MASKKHVAQQAESLPAWYWASGWHDAGITAVESLVFPRDYGTFDGQKRSDIRNLLKLKIDSKGALHDTSVKEIRLYNHKLLTPAASLENGKTSWWLSDRLTHATGALFWRSIYVILMQIPKTSRAGYNLKKRKSSDDHVIKKQPKAGKSRFRLFFLRAAMWEKRRF